MKNVFLIFIFLSFIYCSRNRKFEFRDYLIEKFEENSQFTKNEKGEIVKIKLNKNQHTQLPDIFDRYPKLQTLIFEDNQIPALPLSFEKLRDLEVLNANNNAYFGHQKDHFDVKELKNFTKLYKVQLNQSNFDVVREINWTNLQKIDTLELGDLKNFANNKNTKNLSTIFELKNMNFLNLNGFSPNHELFSQLDRLENLKKLYLISENTEIQKGFFEKIQKMPDLSEVVLQKMHGVDFPILQIKSKKTEIISLPLFLPLNADEKNVKIKINAIEKITCLKFINANSFSFKEFNFLLQDFNLNVENISYPIEIFIDKKGNCGNENFEENEERFTNYLLFKN